MPDTCASSPTAAVTAIANPPPIRTRRAGRVAVVPAALGRGRRQTPAQRMYATMSQMRVVAVGPRSPRNGIRPPTRKLTAEAAEACSGRVAVVSV